MRIRRVLVLAACSFFMVLLLGLIPLSAHALTYTASGTGTEGEEISASAAFEFVVHDFGLGDRNALQITLTNTSPTTSYQGNLLTGFFFSLDDVGNLPTVHTGFDGLAATVRTSNMEHIHNVDIAPAVDATPTDGMYQLSNGPFATAGGIDYFPYRYGISTVGNGLRGFNGAATEGDNYGIAAPGSNLTLDGLPQAVPVIDTTAVFWILQLERLTSLDQLTNARFVFESSILDSKLDAVPIPGSLILFGSGLLGLVGIGRWRK